MISFPTMAVTMQDIARDVGVSVVTVSKVLRNKGEISAATRQRVLRRAKALNYQTNWIARSLVTRRTFTIGLLLPDFTHPFFAEIAKAVAETVRPHGYHVMISYFDENPELERNEAESLLARQVDGLILASAQPGAKAFADLQRRKVPFVLIDRPIAGVQASFVGADNAAIGQLATAHLIEQGCSRIAHLRGPGISIATRRMQGYRARWPRVGCGSFPGYVVDAGYQDDTGHEAMRKLLRKKPVPDGVFCYNDPGGDRRHARHFRGRPQSSRGHCRGGSGQCPLFGFSGRSPHNRRPGNLRDRQTCRQPLTRAHRFEARSATPQSPDRAQTGGAAIHPALEIRQRGGSCYFEWTKKLRRT